MMDHGRDINGEVGVFKATGCESLSSGGALALPRSPGTPRRQGHSGTVPRRLKVLQHAGGVEGVDPVGVAEELTSAQVVDQLVAKSPDTR